MEFKTVGLNSRSDRIDKLLAFEQLTGRFM
jgi:hypothetical protein